MSGVELARIRQGAFRLLAAGFGRPGLEVTDNVAAGYGALLDLGTAQFAFAVHLDRWVDALVAADPAVVASEHVRLFASGIDGAVCPPIESQQLGTNLQGDPARHAGRIEDLMRRSGFSSRNESLPPDHLVTELELASAMCGREAEARESGDPATEWLGWQAELVVVIRTWIGPFAVEVADKDRSGVYRELTGATNAFIEHDYDVVRLLARDESDVG